jgi:ATP-binding cassette, subfamily B (MDR/TAP), member 1
LFLIAIGAFVCLSIQHIVFGSAAARMKAKLHKLSFRAIIRQDVAFFDKDENTTGGLVSSLSDNSQKISSLAGVMLGTILEAMFTLIVGLILGLAFAWKIGLVGLGA